MLTRKNNSKTREAEKTEKTKKAEAIAVIKTDNIQGEVTATNYKT